MLRGWQRGRKHLTLPTVSLATGKLFEVRVRVQAVDSFSLQLRDIDPTAETETIVIDGAKFATTALDSPNLEITPQDGKSINLLEVDR